VSVEFCGIELAHPVINGSGTFDAIAARRAFGNAIDEEFPFAAFVSKTITLAPRAGNPPPRLWEAQAEQMTAAFARLGRRESPRPPRAARPGSPALPESGNTRRGSTP